MKQNTGTFNEMMQNRCMTVAKKWCETDAKNEAKQMQRFDAKNRCKKDGGEKFHLTEQSFTERSTFLLSLRKCGKFKKVNGFLRFKGFELIFFDFREKKKHVLNLRWTSSIKISTRKFVLFDLSRFLRIFSLP